MPRTNPTSRLKTKPLGIRELRHGVGLTFSDLASRAGVTETELRMAERGLELPPNGFVTRIAEVLGVQETEVRQGFRSLHKEVTPGEGYTTAKPVGSFALEPTKTPTAGRIPILDVFCGTGGFSTGFERTGEFQVISGIDLLPDRINTFHANHGAARALCADLTTVDSDEMLDGCPMPEVVIGGPPCQGFSSIRPFRALTENDRRNNLFEHFALVVDAVRPAWFILENVVGLISHQRGATLKALLAVFEGAGYSVSWRVLNAAFYGLPQRRERFVLVGSRDGHDFPWPAPTHYFENARSMAGRHGQHHEIDALWSCASNELRPAVTVMDAISDLPPLGSGESASSYGRRKASNAYQDMMRDGSDALTLHEATKHSPKMLEIIRHAGFNISALPEGLVSSGFSTCYSRLEPDRPSVTLTVNFVHPASNKCIHPQQDRALTPREGARLQGFPDSFTFKGTRAQIVKQIGNAVPPLLGEVVARSLLRAIR